MRRLPDIGAQSSAAGQILLSHAVENSILHAPESDTSFPAFAVAGRRRQATCSDVAWLRNLHLATVNLYGRHLRIYQIRENTEGAPTRLELLHEKTDVAAPEGISVSGDGTMLAISHSMSEDFG